MALPSQSHYVETSMEADAAQRTLFAIILKSHKITRITFFFFKYQLSLQPKSKVCKSLKILEEAVEAVEGLVFVSSSSK